MIGLWDSMSIAVFALPSAAPTSSLCWTLVALPIVVPGASSVVVSEPASPPIEPAADHGRRVGTKGPGARPRRDDFGIGAAGVGRERSVR